MYKFIGGFINTLKPFDDDLINMKLMITEKYLESVINLKENLETLLKICSDSTQKKLVMNYLKKNVNLDDENQRRISNLIDKIIEDIPKITNLENEIKIENLVIKNAIDLFIKNVDDKLKKINEIVKKINNFMRIHCFYDEKDSKKCVNVENTSKTSINYISNYISNTFGFYRYKEIFKLNNIDKYVLLYKLSSADKYYIITTTCNINESDCILYLLNDDLSINKVNIPKDKIEFTLRNQKMYFYNTQKNSISRGKMFSNHILDIVNLINKKELDKSYLDLDPVISILNILYRIDRNTKQYMTDVILKYNNIFIFLAYINKLDVIYDAIDNDMIPESRLFENIKEKIYYGYNFYQHLSNLHDTRVNIDKINNYLRQTKEEVYEKFIEDVKEFYKILKKLKDVCNDSGQFVKDILSNFLNKLFETNDLPLPINKQNIIQSLTKINDYRILDVTTVDEEIKYLKTLSFDDMIYNYTPQFKILVGHKVTFEEHSFTNCGENTIFSLINYLLTHSYVDGKFVYDKKLNIDKLKMEDGTTTKLYDYYKQFTDFDDLIFKYNSTPELINSFAAIFYGKFKGENIYNRGDVCEIKPSEDNYIKLLNNIFNKNFKDIIDFIKHFDDKHKVDIINATTRIINDEYKLSMKIGHADFKQIKNTEATNFDFTPIYDLLYEDFTLKQLSFRNKLLLYGEIKKNNINYLTHELIMSGVDEQIMKDMINNINDKYLDLENYEGNNTLHIATINNLSNIVALLVNKKININVANKYYDTPLRFAIKNKFEDIALIILNKLHTQSDISIKDIYESRYFKGETILMTALNARLIKVADAILDKLIENNLSLDIYNEDGNNLLDIAITNKLSDIAKKLIKYKANINNLNNNNNSTLHISLQNKLYDIAELLIESGANINVVNYYNESPLIYAIILNDEIANKLIDFNADVNLGMYNGLDAFLLSAWFNKITIVKKILNKMDKNILNKNIVDYLDKILKWKKNDVIKILLDYIINNIDKNIKNDAGDTLLHIALKNKNMDAINILIENKFDLNVSDANGKPPLFIALESNDIESIKKLIEYGVNLNVKDTFNRNIFNIAVESNNIELVNILLDTNIDINNKDDNNTIPLLFAIDDKSPILDKLLDKLIERKEDINIMNDNGLTVLDLAIQDNLTDIVAKINSYNESKLVQDKVQTGGNYYTKYMKYKLKYINLKKNIR